MLQPLVVLVLCEHEENLEQLRAKLSGSDEALALTHARRLEQALAIRRGMQVDLTVLPVTLSGSGEQLAERIARLREDELDPVLILVDDAVVDRAALAVREQSWRALGVVDVLVSSELSARALADLLRRTISGSRETRAAERALRRAETCFAVATAMTSVTTRAEVAARLLEGMAALGARACALLELRGEDLVLWQAQGYEPELLRGQEWLALEEPHSPIAEAARVRAPIWLASRLLSMGNGVQRLPVCAALPIVAGGPVEAVLGLDFEEERAPSPDERTSFEKLVESAAHALARARAYESVEQRLVDEQRLLGVASHDLRSPLHLISMASDLLVAQTSLGDPERRLVGQIAESAERAASMVLQLLDLTKLELTQRDLRIAPHDAFAVVRQCVEDFRVRLPECPFSLSCRGAGQMLLDRERIVQVLHNLLANAVHHREPGTAIEVRAEGLRERLYIEVQNRGPVIDPAMFAELFAPMKRGASPGEPGSLGLGLFIVKRLVCAHGGRVWARSNETDGTTFFVELPHEPRELDRSLGTEESPLHDAPPRTALPSEYEPLARLLAHGPFAPLLSHWLELDGPRRLPHPRRFDRSRFVGALADMFFVEVLPTGIGQPDHFRFEEVGAALERRLAGRSLRGALATPIAESAQSSSPPLRAALFAVYQRCVAARRPVFDYFRNGPSQPREESFERLVMPFSRDGMRVTHLIGMATFSGFPEATGSEQQPPLITPRESGSAVSRRES